MANNYDQLRAPVYGAIAASLFTMALKVTAYYLTDSVGLFSDAAESFVNLLASVTALASLWYAAQPVDENHAFGHEKIVYFSTGLEGLLVAIAGIGTAGYAIHRLIYPMELQRLQTGTLIALTASIANLAVARWLLRVGRQHKSLILEADGQHLMTDVWTSMAVITGFALAYITGINVLDPICALLMSAFIVRTGYRLMRQSFDGLMDHALPQEEQARLRHAIDANLSKDFAVHAIRTRQAGSQTFIDFHLLVPGSMNVRKAHAHGDRIEQALLGVRPDAKITVHIEPIEEPASWQDSELISIEKKNE